MTSVSILIPAHNEAAYLPACLTALLQSDPIEGGVEIIVVANGCTDQTADIARGFLDKANQKGWRLEVLELAQGSKLMAWDAGEAQATGDVLIYVDADVEVTSPLVGQIAEATADDEPRYASGHPIVTVGSDRITRLYTRFWLTTPFMTQGVPGFGVFAMNRAGRARWGGWPDIISDDTFARLNFTAAERVAVAGRYKWPMIEGFGRLVQVRRRQDIGVAEIHHMFPQLVGNDDRVTGGVPTWRRALRDPLGFAAFALVRVAVRLPILRSDTRWVRGR